MVRRAERLIERLTDGLWIALIAGLFGVVAYAELTADDGRADVVPAAAPATPADGVAAVRYYAELVPLALTPTVRQLLQEDWDKYAPDPQQVERAYCGIVQAAHDGDGPVYVVVALLPARTLQATPTTVSYMCPAATLSIHTHLPTSCTPAPADAPSGTAPTCVLGGLNAFLCYPSQLDLTDVARRTAVGAVLCSRDAVVGYRAIQLPVPAAPPDDTSASR